jgi:hypothetical protein
MNRPVIGLCFHNEARRQKTCNLRPHYTVQHNILIIKTLTRCLQSQVTAVMESGRHIKIVKHSRRRHHLMMVGRIELWRAVVGTVKGGCCSRSRTIRPQRVAQTQQLLDGEWCPLRHRLWWTCQGTGRRHVYGLGGSLHRF